MSFDKMIQFKALSQIYGNGPDLLENSVNSNNLSEAEKVKMRNVCALIPVELFDRLEQICGFLNFSKREFIEASLIEALGRVHQILEQEGVFDHIENLSNPPKA